MSQYVRAVLDEPFRGNWPKSDLGDQFGRRASEKAACVNRGNRTKLRRRRHSFEVDQRGFRRGCGGYFNRRRIGRLRRLDEGVAKRNRLLRDAGHDPVARTARDSRSLWITRRAVRRNSAGQCAQKRQRKTQRHQAEAHTFGLVKQRHILRIAYMSPVRQFRWCGRTA